MLRRMSALSRRAPAPDLKPDRPLYEEVRASLTEGIAAGRWRAGEAIPSEAELARHFGVAIGTIRKAVDSLVAQGTLARRQGKGTFVTSHDSRRLLFHFFHIVGQDGSRGLPGGAHRFLPSRTRADAAEADGARHRARRAGHPRAQSPVPAGPPVFVDDITVTAPPVPGLTERIFVSRDNTIYHLYQSRYGINVLRTDERLRAITRRRRHRLAARARARRPARWRSAASRSLSATGRWSCASRA